MGSLVDFSQEFADLYVPLKIISIVMAVQQILTPKMFLHSLAVEQFLHVKYFEFYSQLIIVKNLSEIPLWFYQRLFFL